MKRKIFAAFAVLLVVMLATCDLLEPDTRDNEPLFTPDGRPMVRLSIGVGNNGASRAISSAQDPETFVNTANGYYEVAFLDPESPYTTIYRAAWDGNKSGTIAVPMGDYTGATKAILFAGRKSDKTLLAIGEISEIDNIPLGSLSSLGPAGAVDDVAEIFADTESVTFKMYALESGVTVNKATSSFVIAGPKKASPGNVDFTAKDIKSYQSGKGFVFTIPDYDYADSEDDSAAADSSFLDFDTNIVGLYKVKYGTTVNDGSLFGGVMVTSNTWVYSVNYSKSSDPTVDFETRFPTQGKTVPIKSGYGEFYFNIDLSSLSVNEEGLHKVWIEVPVNAIGSDTTRTTPVDWYIRGGLDNEELDGGVAATSEGGAFLLNVGGLNILNINNNW
jgi:hypothetical protein